MGNKKRKQARGAKRREEWEVKIAALKRDGMKQLPSQVKMAELLGHSRFTVNQHWKEIEEFFGEDGRVDRNHLSNLKEKLERCEEEKDQLVKINNLLKVNIGIVFGAIEAAPFSPDERNELLEKLDQKNLLE